ncbi:MAG: 2-hydroxyacyl-CoA dehydratase subunit D, partial [Candidatus Hodarchaeota archaeon]
MTTIEKFIEATPLENPWISKWKNEGKKVMGYFCSYIPEEIMYAADILPIRMRARTCTDTPMGDAYMTPTACSFTRCCLELANRNEYDFLDGIISSNSCDQIRRLYDNIRYKTPFPFHYIMGIPGFVNNITLDWFKHELIRFKENLEKHYDVKISDEKLRKAIKIYNKSRMLLKELYMLRKRDNPSITGTEVLNIISGGISIPREQFNELLTQQLKEIKERKNSSDHKARLMVIGSMLDEPEYMKVIEDMGGLIVTDSLCLGTRYFWDLVDENKDPIVSLAERYLSKVS